MIATVHLGENRGQCAETRPTQRGRESFHESLFKPEMRRPKSPSTQRFPKLCWYDTTHKGKGRSLSVWFLFLFQIVSPRSSHAWLLGMRFMRQVTKISTPLLEHRKPPRNLIRLHVSEPDLNWVQILCFHPCLLACLPYVWRPFYWMLMTAASPKNPPGTEFSVMRCHWAWTWLSLEKRSCWSAYLHPALLGPQCCSVPTYLCNLKGLLPVFSIVVGQGKTPPRENKNKGRSSAWIIYIIFYLHSYSQAPLWWNCLHQHLKKVMYFHLSEKCSLKNPGQSKDV